MKRFPLSLISLSLVSVGFMSSAFAAEVLSEMPTVEIVGSTPLGGVGVPLSQFPANAQTLGAKDSNEQGVTNLAELLNNNIGQVSVSNGTGSGYQNDVNYRGFQASSLLGAPVGLSVYFDGVRMNEPFGSVVNWDLIPMNAMSRVSLLPGSNPMFGLNTLGGALVLDTKNGKDNPGGSIGVLGGSFNRKRVNFENGWVDAKRDTDYFFAGNVDKQNGFRDHSGSDVKQLYGKTRWRGNGGNTRLELSGALADTALSGTQALPMDMMSNTSAAYTWPDRTVNRMTLINLKGLHALDDNNQLAGHVFFRKGSSHNINSNVMLDDGCFDTSYADGLARSNGAIKCVDKAPNGTSTQNVTNANALAYGYGRWTSSINSSLVDSVTKQETIGASLQWSNFDNLLGSKNAWTIGGTYDKSTVTYEQNTYLAKLVNYQTVVTPNQNYGFTTTGLAPSSSNLPTFSGSNVLRGVNLDANTTNFSAYFTDTLIVSDKFSATASGSFNQTTIDQTGESKQYLNDDGGFNWTASNGTSYYNPSYIGSYKSSSLGTSLVTVPSGAVVGPQINSLNGNHKYQRINPAVGFNYNFDKDNGIFGGYSESMRAPTSIELSCADPNSPCALPTGFNGDPDLKAVVAKTFEFGGRGKGGQNTYWNAAVFDSRLSNDIQFIASSAALGYFANVGDTERRGFELGAQTKIDKLYLSANYGYVNAMYRSAFTTAGGQDVTSGNKIPGIAKQTLKLRPAYAVNPDFLVGANVIVVGSQYAHGNESNTDPNGKVAGYGIVNLDAHYSINKELKVSANINNALNKTYATYGLAGMTSVYTLATQQFNTPAPPRGIWVGLTYKLGS